MPNPKICNRISDPAARRRCLNYQGEYAKPGAKQGGAKGINQPWGNKNQGNY